MKTLVFNGWAAGPETWRLTTFAHDWVFDYIEQLEGLPEKVLAETEEALIVGFSMGGNSAMRMVLEFPEKIKGLVLVSTTPYMMEERDHEGKLIWRGLSNRRLAALRLGTEMTFKHDPSPMYDTRQMARGLEYLKGTDLRGRLERIATKTDFPVAIFQSEKDGIVRPHNAAYLQRIFPQAKVTMVPGAEHVLPIAIPELIDAAVKEITEGS